MKIAVFVLLCALESIYGHPTLVKHSDNFRPVETAVQDSITHIRTLEDSWQSIDINIFQHIGPQIDELKKYFDEAADRLHREIRDKNIIKFIESSRQTFENFIGQTHETVKEVARRRKFHLYNTFNVRKLTLPAYETILTTLDNVLEDIETKGSCETVLFSELVPSSLTAIATVTNCASDAVAKFPLLPQTVLDIRKIAKDHTYKATMALQKCSYEVDTTCFDVFNKEFATATEEIADIVKQYDESPHTTITFTRDHMVKCIDRELKSYEKIVNTQDAQYDKCIAA